MSAIVANLNEIKEKLSQIGFKDFQNEKVEESTIVKLEKTDRIKLKLDQYFRLQENLNELTINVGGHHYYNTTKELFLAFPYYLSFANELHKKEIFVDISKAAWEVAIEIIRLKPDPTKNRIFLISTEPLKTLSIYLSQIFGEYWKSLSNKVVLVFYSQETGKYINYDKSEKEKKDKDKDKKDS